MAARSGFDRKHYNRMMKWIRRVHMYLGLLMLPWMVLYGITGFLFNHPTLFPDHEIRTLRDVDMGLPDAMDVAQRVMARLAEVRGDSAAAVQLIHPERVRYRYQGFFNTRLGNERYELAVNPVSGDEMFHTRPVDVREGPFGNLRRLDLEDSTRARLRTWGIAEFQRLGVDTDYANPRWGPQVVFDTKVDGKVWEVAYNLGNRDLMATPKDGWSGLTSIRQYLLRLHVAHTFPLSTNARTFWAVMVDLMALVMVLWGLTGLLMWWQMKVVRITGGIVLAISLVWAIGLGYAMYDLFRF